MSQGQSLRNAAQALAGALPPVLAHAERLAATVAMGVHGRKRAGTGESFWQYRHAMPGDSAANIDWRRSAQGDALFIREREWEAAQTVAFWCDASKSMDYQGKGASLTKAMRAQVLTLALASLLTRAGERVALLETRAQAAGVGETKLQQMALALHEADFNDDYGTIPLPTARVAGHRVFLSDFMGPEDEIFPALNAHADAGGEGCLVQILDPSEETFPFDGRIIFESMGGVVDFETLRAKALRKAYQDRLAERSAKLAEWARRVGWHFTRHRTDESPRAALLWLFMAVGGQK
ncbi:MAG: DUF58 domain-containing protein [Rhodobacteraceae bacterium]|nr:DUF58 domain-containing protein [Paracoccaceae bacterium]